MKASKKDRSTVVNILTTQFKNDPNILAKLKRDDEKYVRKLMTYVFDTIQPISGIYLTEDRRGVAVCYQPVLQTKTFRSLYLKIKLSLGIIGLRNLRSALKRKKKIISHHPQDGKYLNCWLIAIKNKSLLSTFMSLKKEISQDAHQLNIPIYIETHKERKKKIAEYYGFQLYDSLLSLNSNTLFFMRKY